MSDALPIYTVYFNPSDFPGLYVVRMFFNDKPTTWVHSAETLEAVRERIPPGLVCLVRFPEDAPVIVECWP